MLVKRIGKVAAGLSGFVQAVKCPVVTNGEPKMFGGKKTGADDKTNTVAVEERQSRCDARYRTVGVVFVIQQPGIRQAYVEINPVKIGVFRVAIGGPIV